MSAAHVKKLKQFLNMCGNEGYILDCFRAEAKRFGFKPYIEFDPFLKVNLSLFDFLNPKVDEAGVLKYCRVPNSLSIKNIFVSCIKITFPYSILKDDFDK